MTRKYTKPVRGKKTREEWLTQMVRVLHAELFQGLPAKGINHGIPRLLPKFRVSCSWPGGGSARSRIGECWPSVSSATGHIEMFISPKMSDVVKVVETLVHEMCHMYLDCNHGHKAPFARLAFAVGLAGKPTSTHADENLVKAIKRWAKKCGKYPHADMSGLGGRTKQTTRLVKASCLDSDCGCVIRITNKWVEAMPDDGLTCPVCQTQGMEIG